MLPTINDTRGKPSSTLPFVVSGFVLLMFKFAFAGTETFLGILPPMTAGEFGGAFAAIVGCWVAREWKAKEVARNG